MSQDGQIAFGKPGIEPRWTSSTKDAIGTAYAASSRVWFTLSHGILNEIYYPRIDMPQMRDVEFLITDGQSFFHEEKRDLRHEIAPLDGDVLGYRIVSSDREGRYRLVKEYISDPHQACVLVHVTLEGQQAFLATLRLFLLAAPHLAGGGMHNTGWRARVVEKPILAATRESFFLTAGATVPFSHVSCGYVGVNDGWTDLRDNFRLDYGFERAEDGNIALTAELEIARQKSFTLGLAFGRTFHDAATSLNQSLATPFARHRERFIQQWRRACSQCDPLEEHARDGGRLYQIGRAHV
jgi:glucoamylase